MPTILVDYENVNGADGLKGVDVLNQDDTLIIFYSAQCERIRYEYIREIEDSGCEFSAVKLERRGKNALDFYIASECGAISERGEKQIAIISKDKGYQSVIDYLTAKCEDLKIVKAGSIEVALTLLDDQSDAKRRALLHKRIQTIDLEEEYDRIKEKNRKHKELKQLLKEKGYASKSPEIINLLEEKKDEGKQELYRETLHCFGKKAGGEIYQIIKDF